MYTLKAACHANPGAVEKRAGLHSYISTHVFQTFSNTSANNNASLWIYKSRYSSKFLFQNLYRLFLCACSLRQ